jgi:hypothetical protein
MKHIRAELEARFKRIMGKKSQASEVLKHYESE